MTRILLPTDFSDNSFKAITYALSLYKNVSCTFYILNTYMPPVYHTEYILGSPGQIGLGDMIKEESEKSLKELKTKLEDEFKNPLHTFITHSAFNMLTNEIVQITEAEKIDLVIMGTKGATGAQEILLGTNTVHVLKNSKCPVLAIPQGFDFEKPKVILFPSDFEVSLTKENPAILLQIVKEHNSEINVMHVFTELKLNPTQTKNRKSLETLLGNNGLFHDVGSDEIITAINKFQLKVKIDFLGHGSK
ncbi:universal stress protein [Maribacter litopenaei]|uniref:Universal stress protein n=1 Tax=Maribacter litopenaei TaxID=2976127 RepID=A0ABY5Y8D4_9FLAO|nr:universal stress protein [Maribacter litopenaei]UWX54410.1 universal stress protein [Maribacter litopenaei]